MSECLKTFSLAVATGTTPCAITQLVGDALGSIIIPVAGGDPTYVPTVVSYGTFAVVGRYRVDYVKGAFKAQNVTDHTFSYYVNTQTVDLIGAPTGHGEVTGNEFPMAFQAAGVAGPDQATAEAFFHGFFTGIEFDHTSGEITLTYQSQREELGGNFANNFSAGAPNPTFSLTRTQIYHALPPKLRIQNYNPLVFSVCPGEDSTGQPAWDGTLGDGPGLFIYAPTLPGEFYLWDSAQNQVSINGQDLFDAEILYVNDGSAPSSSGCGWSLEITLRKGGAPDLDLWFGYKTTGNDPTGAYVRASGCSAGPASLTIESY